jgi:predicted Zn-dependent protease
MRYIVKKMENPMHRILAVTVVCFVGVSACSPMKAKAPATPVAQGAQAAPDGVQGLGRMSSARQLVDAQQIEGMAQKQYAEMLQEASAKGALAPPSNAQVQRLRAIAAKLVPFAPRFNERATQWKWEVNLLGSKQINAFCMPGGKIAFYTGILDNLDLTDDEVATVMGHEIAHALREHGRERMGKAVATQGVLGIGSALLGLGDLGRSVAGGAANLLSLKFGRDDETEGDLVGMDLAARAGYDPRAGVTLWQKMAAASKGAPPDWLSTHPSGENRIAEISKHLPEVMPLYAKAKGVARSQLAPFKTNWPTIPAVN